MRFSSVRFTALVVGSVTTLVGSGVAQAAPLAPAGLIGAYNNQGYAGVSLGFSYGNRNDGVFGAQFANSVMLDSVTVTQSGDGNARQRLKDVDVYTAYGQYLTSIQFSDPGVLNGPSAQTVSLSSPVLINGHVNLRVRSKWGGAVDPNGGFVSFSFDGTDLGTPLDTPNGNLSATMTTTGPLGGNDLPNITKDLNILSNNTSQATFFVRDGSNNDTLTATYGSMQHVVAIGLGLANDNSNRVMPKFITLTGSGFGQSQVITLDADSMHYRRYLFGTAWDTTFLKITFPDDGNAANWDITGSDNNYGVTEFQAFLPEPASLGLVVGGMMFVGARRRK